jgi:hypothetical protein
MLTFQAIPPISFQPFKSRVIRESLVFTHLSFTTMTTWNHPYWYTQPHPHVYVPPPQGFTTPGSGYRDLPGINPHFFGMSSDEDRVFTRSYAPYAGENYRSRRYPNMNPFLASDTTVVRFDARNKPEASVPTAIFDASRLTPASSVPIYTMRILSRSFPWTIDIVSGSGPGPASPITCAAVWQAIYAALQEPIEDSEWGLALGDRGRREIIEQAAAKRRVEDGDTDKKLKRIDWLGDATIFKGLDRDDDFAKRRLLPGSTPCVDTWIVTFDEA